VELARHGITANGVMPTVVRGDVGAHWLADPAVRDRLPERIPLGRVAAAQDVATQVQFFYGPGASFVTGQALYVDGDLTATQ
jgi:NAD(P)-dependent dehydrogenase (short-subunit alcohol dehydrogenase family)